MDHPAAARAGEELIKVPENVPFLSALDFEKLDVSQSHVSLRCSGRRRRPGSGEQQWQRREKAGANVR